MIYTDKELVDQIKNDNDETALLELVDRHSGAFYKTVSDYIPFTSGENINEEFYGRREEFFYDAAKTFKEEKGVKFSTWLVNSTRYKCLTERTRLSNSPEFYEFGDDTSLYLDDIDYMTPDLYLQIKEDANEILNQVKRTCGEDARKIIEERYFGGENSTGRLFKDIAKDLGVSTQHVEQTHSKTIKRIKRFNRV